MHKFQTNRGHCLNKKNPWFSVSSIEGFYPLVEAFRRHFLHTRTGSKENPYKRWGFLNDR